MSVGVVGGFDDNTLYAAVNRLLTTQCVQVSDVTEDGRRGDKMREGTQRAAGYRRRERVVTGGSGLRWIGTLRIGMTVGVEEWLEVAVRFGDARRLFRRF